MASTASRSSRARSGRSPTATTPAGVAARQAAGKVNIITFSDFQCPHCRNMHPVIDEVAGLHTDRIVVTRMMFPLKSHHGADRAALAYLCAPADKKNALADKLYSAPRGKFTRDGMIAFAREVGMDEAAFAKCYESADTRARLQSDAELFKASGLRGIPATFVQSELIEGADVEGFLAAVDRSLAGGRLGTEWLFALLVGALLAAAAASLAAARKHAGPQPADGVS